MWIFELGYCKASKDPLLWQRRKGSARWWARARRQLRGAVGRHYGMLVVLRKIRRVRARYCDKVRKL